MKEPLKKFKEVAPILPSLNFRQTIDFYTKKLGFALTGQYPDYLILQREGVALHFWLCDDPNIPKASACYIYVAGVEEIYQDFEKEGIIHPNGKLTETNYGIKEFALIDIHGNLLRIGELINF